MAFLLILGMSLRFSALYPSVAINPRYREQNMFSFTSSQAHKQRRRVFAAAYSKSAVSHHRVQTLIKARTTKLLHFLDHQLSIDVSSVRKTGAVVVRNVFRALQADIFTAFAFSEAEGTTFLDNLTVGPNTLEDLRMEEMDLCHDERRDVYFFWESEKPFKYIVHIVDRNGPTAHNKAQAWLAGLAHKFEERERLTRGDDHSQLKMGSFDQGPYTRIWRWKDDTGRPLSFKERTSEIMDHTGMSPKLTAFMVLMDDQLLDKMLCRRFSNTPYDS